MRAHWEKIIKKIMPGFLKGIKLRIDNLREKFIK
jgi:hypothetical protein